MTLRRLRIEIGFDGASWHGWHAGRTGRGVADQVQLAVASILPNAGELVSSSRTDSGVHARQLTAHVDVPQVEMKIAIEKLAEVTNHQLPPTIRVLSVVEAPMSFHARFGAQRKEYRYHLWNDRVMHPLRQGQAWHLPQPLNLTLMQAAAAQFVGRHDFSAFTAKRDGELKSPFRSVTRCAVHRRRALVVVRIEADGFLYKMCRAITGALVEVGRGKRSIDQLTAMLASGAGSEICLAPAHGLVLWRVDYDEPSELNDVST